MGGGALIVATLELGTDREMRGKLQQAGLVMVGLCAGVALSLNFSANANKDATSPLPVEELRTFAEVFNAIKQGYVEPVDEKKLIREVILTFAQVHAPHADSSDSNSASAPGTTPGGARTRSCCCTSPRPGSRR